MDKKNLRITDLPADRRRQEDIESWNGFLIVVISKLAVLRMALAGIENAEHSDEDWLRDVRSCQPLIDEADIGERPEVGCLTDLTLEIVEFADKRVHLDNHVVGVLLEKIGLIQTALDGFKTNDQAWCLGSFVRELMNYLDMHYFRGKKDDLKDKIKAGIDINQIRESIINYYREQQKAQKQEKTQKPQGDGKK